jgi:Peptidase family M23
MVPMRWRNGWAAAFCVAIILSAPAASATDGPLAPDSLPFLGGARLGCGYLDCNANTYHPWPAVDFRLPEGTPVRATAPGRVELVDEEIDGDGDPAGCAEVSGTAETAYCGRPGRFVVIGHDEGPYSVYKHLKATHVVAGQEVERGQVIGQVGNTQATNFHLHYDEQSDPTRINAPGNRVPIGPVHYWNRGRRTGPRAWGGRADWSGGPFGTTVLSQGWLAPPLHVESERGLRRALTSLAVSIDEGPFVLHLDADITLTRAQLQWRGDELLIILGHDHLLRSRPNSRVLYSTGPLELNRVRFESVGHHQYQGRAVFSTELITEVGESFPAPREVISTVQVVQAAT